MPDQAERCVDVWLTRYENGSPVIALGYSGGGDSLALLAMMCRWAKPRGIGVKAFIVDHGLRPDSAREAEMAAARARALGADSRILVWMGNKPESGLQAAARRARHGLLVTACREERVQSLYLAHTADDQAETVWMRLSAGGGWRSLAGMSTKAPSPLWPQGRDITLMRPLLGVRRSVLRHYLQQKDASWIEDPSNADVRFARISIRNRLGMLEDRGFAATRLCELADQVRDLAQTETERARAVFARIAHIAEWGGIRIDQDELSACVPVIRRRVMETAMRCVSGRTRPADTKIVDRIVSAVLNKVPASGGGVNLIQSKGVHWLIRDRGEMTGRVDRPGLAAVELAQNDSNVWDGRYEIETRIGSVSLEPLGEERAGLDDAACLQAVPGAARSGLLAVRQNGVVIAIAGVMNAPGILVRSLLETRMRGLLHAGVEKAPGNDEDVTQVKESLRV